jgi:hypothetical protein
MHENAGAAGHAAQQSSLEGICYASHRASCALQIAHTQIICPAMPVWTAASRAPAQCKCQHTCLRSNSFDTHNHTQAHTADNQYPR